MSNSGLYQAYVAVCAQCSGYEVIYTPHQAAARVQLTKRGWGTSQGKYYCPTHLTDKQKQARQAARAVEA